MVQREEDRHRGVGNLRECEGEKKVVDERQRS